MSNKKSSAKFYSEPAVEELYTGFLLKSPPLTTLTKNTKSWKRRFFVLAKTAGETYQLTYHVNTERREKPLGVIDISKISLLFTGPETHQKWDWVKKQFKGSPSSVLFLKVEDDTIKLSREYFLIGENSADVDGWLNELLKVMKTRKFQNKPEHTDDTQEIRCRSMTIPVEFSERKVKDQTDDRRSAYELTSSSQHSHYDYPRRLCEPLRIPIPVIQKTYEMDGKQDQPLEDNNEYMSMESVQRAKDDQQDDDLECTEKNEVYHHSNQSLNQNLDFTENCASTESNNSEFHTDAEEEPHVSQNDLKNSLNLTEGSGKPCASERHQTQESRGAQTLPPDIQKCIKSLSKDEIKLLLQRLPGLTPNPAHHTKDTKQSLMPNLSSRPK